MSKSRITLNRKIAALLDEREKAGQALTPEEIEFIQGYSGLGGLASSGETKRGVLYEYYTPYPIVEKMWGLAFQYGFTSGVILEPSCGTGRFLRYVDPANNTVDAFEYSKDDRYGYLVAKNSYPWANITNDYFESIYYDGNKRKAVAPKYHLVIGNPPYGDFAGYYSGKGREKSHTEAATYDQYFIEKGIELLLPGGLLVFIIPSTFLDNDLAYNNFKKQLFNKCDLLDAYRLPESVFEHTQIQTDIIVLKKHE